MCCWFAKEVYKYLNDNEYIIDLHIYRIVDCEKNCFKAQFVGCNNLSSDEEVLYQKIKENYIGRLRGKNLLELLLHFFNKKDRKSKYSKWNIFEISLRAGKNEFTNELIDKIMADLQLSDYYQKI